MGEGRDFTGPTDKMNLYDNQIQHVCILGFKYQESF